MSDKIKIGLTRNRLFEFNNAVVFCGKPMGYGKATLNKALKLLCLKEPVITSVATLCKHGECYIEADMVSQELIVSEKNACEIKKDFAENGLSFDEKLFEFVLSDDGYLVVGAHTLVADCKSLLRLAMELAQLCGSGVNSVVPMGIEPFSDTTALPMEVNSPLTDKLSAELDSKWQKISRKLSVADYKSAREVYFGKRSFSDELTLELSSERTAVLAEFCAEQGVDLSSVIGFAFYKALHGKLNPAKKHGKMCIHADRRFFIQNAENVSVGAFNGFCEASLGDKERKLDLNEQIKAFHKSCYKGVTSPFKTFYDEVLLMKVSPSYCDSAYMYLAGSVKDKPSKKLAQNYGCMNEQLCEFFSCNLEQNYWRGLDVFSDISVTEPLKERFAASVGFLRVAGGCKITLRFNNRRLDESGVQCVITEAMDVLNKI